MITEIAINGTALDLDGVVFNVAVSHGRNDIQSAPQASDARVLLRGFSEIPAEIGDVLQIEAYSEARFTGTVTDITLTHDYSHHIFAYLIHLCLRAGRIPAIKLEQH